MPSRLGTVVSVHSSSERWDPIRPRPGGGAPVRSATGSGSSYAYWPHCVSLCF